MLGVLTPSVRAEWYFLKEEKRKRESTEIRKRRQTQNANLKLQPREGFCGAAAPHYHHASAGGGSESALEL